MPAYDLPVEPVALPGQAVRLDPDDEVFEVTAIEQLGVIGPEDYGAASAGGEASESGSDIIDLVDEIEFTEGTLGQVVINPLSRVELEIRQTGNQDQRLVTSNSVGNITPWTPVNQRQVFVRGGGSPQAIIHNDQTWDMAKTLIQYTGFKLVLGDRLTEGEVEQMRGEPAAVTVDSLKQFTGGRR